MEIEFIKLFHKFNAIRNLGWVESLREGSGGIGYTFETLLGKKEDHLQLPDYLGIEIKTLKYLGKRKIHLFCATPDGDVLFPIERIINVLGYPDKEFRYLKVLSVNLNATDYHSIGNKLVKIKVNWDKRKVELLVYNIYLEKLDINISWSFSLLEKALKSKLRKLAVVMAYYKRKNGKDYYYYKHISFYELKNTETFFKLIEKGDIGISFNIGICKDTNFFGKLNDRGTNFSIKEKNISLLFNKIDF